MKRLSEADLERVREAVSEAERRTSAEIVPYVVQQSAAYEEAVWRGAATGALLALLFAAAVFQFYAGWGFGWLHTGWGIALLTLAAGVAGALMGAFVPPVRRLLAGAELITRSVHTRAMVAFLEEEVFGTRERTGILIFISLFEHRIEVLGDAGINQRVTPDEWAAVVARIRRDLRGGKLVEGILDGIRMCGELLEKSGVEIRHDDTDELHNEMRLRKK